METITKDLYRAIFQDLVKILIKNTDQSNVVMDNETGKYIHYCMAWDYVRKGIKRPALKKEYVGEWRYWADTDLINEYGGR